MTNNLDFSRELVGRRALARRAGFKPVPVWTNPQRLFSVHWLHAP